MGEMESSITDRVAFFLGVGDFVRSSFEATRVMASLAAFEPSSNCNQRYGKQANPDGLNYGRAGRPAFDNVAVCKTFGGFS